MPVDTPVASPERTYSKADEKVSVPCESLRVIYVTGTGRSGTTLLDVVLGNARSTFSCGEIRKFLDLDGRPAGRAPESDVYTFWSNIRAELKEKFRDDRLRKIVRRMESHGWFPVTWANLWSKRSLELYSDYSVPFLDQISSATGAELLVDSSKYPGRMLSLSRCLGESFKVIYLRRSRRDVVRSLAKKNIEQPRKGWLAANVYYFMADLMCRLALARMPRKSWVSVEYGKLIEDPVGTLELIQKELGIDLERSIEIARSNRAFVVGQLFEGNRIRRQETVRILTKKQKAA